MRCFVQMEKGGSAGGSPYIMSIKEDPELELLSPESDDSENIYEVERIMDRREDRRGVYYLIKWKGYSDSEATWEPEAHLHNVKWMLQEYEDECEKTKRKKLDTLLQRKEQKHQRAVSTHSSPDSTTYSIPKKAPKLQRSMPAPMEVYAQLATRQCPPIIVQMAQTSITRGNLSLDNAVKILGCRKRSHTIEYAVLFKPRTAGQVLLPQICTHEELKALAPWLLCQYLLDAGKVE